MSALLGLAMHTYTVQVFNQEFIVDERYNVTKELGQGAYGIVWCDDSGHSMRPPC